jgi:hypothetical protein
MTVATPNRGAPTGSNYSGPAVPIGLVYVGVVVGLILIFLGIGLLSYGRGSLLSSLMTCVGFGIVLASFGSTAKGTWAGWTVTGAGALAIVLFLVLQHYQAAAALLYKKGQLRGDLSKIADLRIIDELPMYAYRDRTTSSIRFVLLDKKLRSNRLSIQVDTTEKGAGHEFFEIIGDAQAIQARYLSEGTDNERQIQWTFDYDKRVVKDGQDTIFSEQDTLQEALVPSRRTGLLDWLPAMDILIPKARAQNAAAPQSTAAVGDLVAKLKSDDTAERRNARDALSALGPASVSAMMSAARSNSSDYRVRLGVLYALSEMLRRNPEQRTAISAALKDEDFPFLVAAASDNDKTIRMQAADFLYLLQDSRAVPSSVEAARSTPDTSKASNQVLIIRQSGLSLTAADKEKVINDLSAGPGRNNDLVGSTGYLRRTLGW